MSESDTKLPTLEMSMTDGPFRNADLSFRWKRYGDDLVSDATSPDVRVARACDAMLGDLDLDKLSHLLEALQLNAQKVQMDLDPVAVIDDLVDDFPRSSFSDALKKHLASDLQNQMSSEAALDHAIGGAVRDLLATTKNRLDEECIEARDRGDMSQQSYLKALERNRQTFAALDRGKFCDALVSGDKGAFQHALKKKVGVDEGPE